MRMLQLNIARKPYPRIIGVLRAAAIGGLIRGIKAADLIRPTSSGA
jgi:hypothetical protein